MSGITSGVLVEDNPLHAQHFRENRALAPGLLLVGEFSRAGDVIPLGRAIADIGSSGGMVGPITRSTGVPRLDPIAPQFLRPGVNELLVRLRVAPWP